MFIDYCKTETPNKHLYVKSPARSAGVENLGRSRGKIILDLDFMPKVPILDAGAVRSPRYHMRKKLTLGEDSAKNSKKLRPELELQFAVMDSNRKRLGSDPDLSSSGNKPIKSRNLSFGGANIVEETPKFSISGVKRFGNVKKNKFAELSRNASRKGSHFDE